MLVYPNEIDRFIKAEKISQMLKSDQMFKISDDKERSDSSEVSVDIPDNK